MILAMNTVATRNDWVGRVIDGKFPLLEWLGNTGQAGVFRTELKLPQPGRAVIRLLAAEPQHAEARLHDWRQAAALSHPHLMRIFESGRTQVGGVELLYVVTEYADESLAQVIPERPLTTGEAREMLGPIVDALTYLHGQGMVHGHIKPSNIMVVGDRLKLPVESLRRAGSSSQPRAPLKIYDAPELTTGTLASAADIWSLGITLVEALMQHQPSWDHSTHRDPVVPAEIPEPFAEIARGCLRLDPAKRATLRDIRKWLNPSPSLQKAANQEPANEIDQVAPVEVLRRAPESRQGTPSRRRIAAIVAGIVVVLAVIVFALTRSHHPQPAAPAAQSPVSAVPQPHPQPPVSHTAPRSVGTVKAQVTERVMPDVSASANRTIRGKINMRVRLNVDANGAVANAQLESAGQSRYFTSRALDAARKWRFRPAQQDGRTVPSVWNLRFQFRRSGPEVNAEQVSP